jgi:putative FmdB family regulatory protein
MPLYEYECQKCKDRFEVIQKVSDRPLARCKKCGGKLRKLLSAAGLQFKGSGWYVTDYAGQGKKQESSEKQNGSAKGAEAPKPGKESPAKKSKETS